MINKQFVGGLLPHLEREIAPRVREIQEQDPIEGVLQAAVEAERAAPAQKKDPPFQASSIAALNVSGVTEEDLSRMEPSVRQAIVAAFGDSSRGRGRGDWRGGARGRGRGAGGGRGGYSSTANNEGDRRTLTSIQSRTKARFCNNCKQWCKHLQSECRHTRNEIAAMVPQQENLVPEKGEPIFDQLYDDKEVMPVFPGNA